MCMVAYHAILLSAYQCYFTVHLCYNSLLLWHRPGFFYVLHSQNSSLRPTTAKNSRQRMECKLDKHIASRPHVLDSTLFCRVVFAGW